MCHAMNETLESAFNKLGFTRYEALAFLAIVKFKNLDAQGITQHSGVPQPKVYETMEKLLSRGLIDKIPLGRKFVYEVKQKSLVEEKIGEIQQDFSNSSQFILSNIDSTYGTEQGSEIPFVGIAGTKQIIEYLSYAIDDARESVSSFMPHHLMQQSIVASLSIASEKVQVSIICREEADALELVDQLPNVQVYVMETRAFEIVQEIGQKIESFLPPSQKASYAFGIIQNLLQNFSDIFGLTVFDQRKSFFLVPIPLGVPMAIISTLPEMLQFHTEGINEILKSSRLIK